MIEGEGEVASVRLQMRARVGAEVEVCKVEETGVEEAAIVSVRFLSYGQTRRHSMGSPDASCAWLLSTHVI